MTQVTAGMIKELREATGAGMLDCRKALTENAANMDEAVNWLKKKGLSAAAKKSDRVAAEGLVAVAVDGNKGTVIELNSETDFVARNEQFQALTSKVAQLALTEGDDIEKLKASVAADITQAIATIGENMTLRRSATLSVDKGVVASYVHSAISAGMGKIAVLVGLESEGDASKLEAFGKQLAMHIAASNPTYQSKSDVTDAIVKREEDAASEQAAKFFDAYVSFETAVSKYKEKMTSDRAFSEKVFDAKLTELAQTLPNVDELLADVAKGSTSEDRKEKQNAEKTNKLLSVFFQEAAYMLKKMRSYGDDAAIKEKLTQLKISRFFEESVLEEQIFVIDGKSKISQAIEDATKDIGAPIKLSKFISYRLGEGIEKVGSDFAAEVAAASGVAAA
ncbi:MAG: translation elongation factor Ts [Rickettsiales bacterium]